MPSPGSTLGPGEFLKTLRERGKDTMETIHVQNRGKRAIIVKREDIIKGDAQSNVQDRHPHTGNIGAGTTVQMRLEAGLKVMNMYPNELIPWGPQAEQQLKDHKAGLAKPGRHLETPKPMAADVPTFQEEEKKDDIVDEQDTDEGVDDTDEDTVDDEEETDETEPAKKEGPAKSPKKTAKKKKLTVKRK